MNREKLFIVKIGGNIIEDEEKLGQALDLFTRITPPKILIHGGGKRASDLLKLMGIEPQMVQGRRITDGATLEVVTMVYAGLINKKIVSGLQARSCNAIGLSGTDGNSILAHKRIVKDIDYGFAGDIDKVNGPFIYDLLSKGNSPVFCAITHDGKGQLLNTNADTIAAEIAKAVAKFYEVNLFYCFEKKGVLLDPQDDNSVIEQLDYSTYQNHKTTGIISAGMIPKLDNAFSVLKQEVHRVIIGNIEAIEGQGGTVLSL